jgi:hypothetical protein
VDEVVDAFSLTDVADVFGVFAPTGGRVEALQTWAPDPGRDPLTRNQMRSIVQQAAALLDRFYVYLPQKQQLYAVDPVARLDLLDRGLRSAGSWLTHEQERTAHRELTSIFTSLRDCHTNYLLPDPYRRYVAFLPFLIERCRVTSQDSSEHTAYVVTKRFASLTPELFGAAPGDGPPIVVTHWNGIPIESAVELNGALNPGGNADARMARGLKRLTFRWLGLSATPVDDWVVLTYDRDGERHDVRFPWAVAERVAPETGHLAGNGRGAYDERQFARATSRGLDAESEWLRRIERDLFVAQDGHPRDGSAWNQLDLRSEELGDQRLAVLRIFSFAEDGDVTTFLDDARSHLRTADGDSTGLVLDIRGNPGGDIRAAEGLARMLSDRIESPSLQFLNTGEAADLAQTWASYSGVEDPLRTILAEAIASGAPYLPSPSLPDRGLPTHGVAYKGPKTLVVDPLTYSSGDVFAALFQDYGIGKIVGTGQRTGGGGGNGWEYDDIRACDPAEILRPLPLRASFDVAIRRTLRAGKRAGLSLEDAGVDVDDVHEITLDDVRQGNRLLLSAAGAAMRGVSG